MSAPLALLVALGVSTSTSGPDAVAGSWRRAGLSWEVEAEATLGDLEATAARLRQARATIQRVEADATAAGARAEVHRAELRRDLVRTAAERDARPSRAAATWLAVGAAVGGAGLAGAGTALVACEDASCRATGLSVGAVSVVISVLVLYLGAGVGR